ncbi:hypothetical protein ACFQRB_00645 [Halobaculum litoreum]|uniref:Uncharacterized protein n=1 Tax=Halobaculum litoreum TaxID=3031998 RepID=A0ABD5XK80_9EURY
MEFEVVHAEFAAGVGPLEHGLRHRNEPPRPVDGVRLQFEAHGEVGVVEPARLGGRRQRVRLLAHPPLERRAHRGVERPPDRRREILHTYPPRRRRPQ